MKNLMSKLSISALMAASALSYSGCGTDPVSMRQQEAVEKRLLLGVLGGVVMDRGIQQGNVIAASVGDHMIGSAVQRDHTANVNYPAQAIYPQSQPQTTLQLNPFTVFACVSWVDLNKDGAIQYPQEFIYPGKSRFVAGDTIRGVVYGNNNPASAVNAQIINLKDNSIVMQTDSIPIHTNQSRVWELPSANPGLYIFRVRDQNNVSYGEAILEITPHPGTVAARE